MPNLNAGEYGAYIWPAYGITALVLIWMVADTLLKARAWKAKAEAGRKEPEGK